MIESDNLNTTSTSVYHRLTHSFQEDLQRISWIVRPTDPTNSVGGSDWIWPNDDPTTFHSRLTHSYDPTAKDRVTFSTVSTSTSAAFQTTSEFSSTSKFVLTKFETTLTEPTLTEATSEMTETVVDEPFVALDDMSPILFDNSESSFPGSNLSFIQKGDCLKPNILGLDPGKLIESVDNYEISLFIILEYL